MGTNRLDPVIGHCRRLRKITRARGELSSCRNSAVEGVTYVNLSKVIESVESVLSSKQLAAGSGQNAHSKYRWQRPPAS